MGTAAAAAALKFCTGVPGGGEFKVGIVGAGHTRGLVGIEGARGVAGVGVVATNGGSCWPSPCVGLLGGIRSCARRSTSVTICFAQCLKEEEVK